jgi:hypothetical protein
VPHQFFNSSRCGHVDMVIDPSAFKESVAVSGLVSRSGRIFWRELKAGRYGRGLSFSRMRARSAEGYVVSKSDGIHGGGRSLESNESWLHRSRKPIVRAGVSGSEGCFQALPAPFQRPSD